MSQSHSARKGLHRNDLKGLDVLFAIVLHLLVVAVIATLAWWQSRHEPEPMKRIEVRMISAQQLAEMQHKKPAHPKTAPRPKKKPMPKATPTPKAKSTPKSKPATSEQPFDPFAPVESSSDRTDAPDTAPNRDLATIMERQLSTQELERYIAMMQDAVQRHWKVPAGVSESTPDPLVEVELHPDGRVARITIIESSGNDALDRTLVAAIRAAAPFQIPRQQFEAFRINRIRFHPLK